MFRYVSIVSICLLGLLTVAGYSQDSSPAKSNSREHLQGMRGNIEWQSLLGETDLEGWVIGEANTWSRHGDTVIVRSGQNRHTSLAYGDTTWANYELRVGATFVKGSNLQIQFRRSADGKDFYFLDFLMGWKAISVTKKEGGVPGVTKLDVTNFPIEYGREYDILIAVRGESIHTYINGHLVNRLTHGFRRRGGVALATWGKNTVVYFREPKIRHYH